MHRRFNSLLCGMALAIGMSVSSADLSAASFEHFQSGSVESRNLFGAGGLGNGEGLNGQFENLAPLPPPPMSEAPLRTYPACSDNADGYPHCPSASTSVGSR